MVWPLSEGTFTVNESKKFVPFDPLKDSIEDRPASLIADVVPFLIKTKKDLIIIDPGLGFQAEDSNFIIHKNLLRHGFSAEDITMVLLSHLHKDHAGGICYDKAGAFHLMFTNADYYSQQKEMEYALTKINSPSYELDKLIFLQRSPQWKPLNGDGEIGGEIHFEISGGHTPYHQVFIIQSDNQKFFYGGDVLPQSSQIIRRFVAKYDFDGKMSARLREKYAKLGVAENYCFLFFHDGKIPLARLHTINNRFEIEALPEI